MLLLMHAQEKANLFLTVTIPQRLVPSLST